MYEKYVASPKVGKPFMHTVPHVNNVGHRPPLDFTACCVNQTIITTIYTSQTNFSTLSQKYWRRKEQIATPKM